MEDTLFHKVKFGLLKTFHICFEIATSAKSFSVLQEAKSYSVRPQMVRMFMDKVRDAMKSIEKQPVTGTGHVNEFVVWGQRNRARRKRAWRKEGKSGLCRLID
jgi:hypothetical protein